jgi:hypothetical protein
MVFGSRLLYLFNDKRLKDDTFDSDYYDGSIESLEKYINSNGITALAIGDVELFNTLFDRGNISNNNKMSIFISRTGYNMFLNDKGFQLKYYDKFKTNLMYEVGVVGLIQFERSTIEYFKKGN